MSGRIFQNVVLQLKENTDRTVGVIDGEGIVIACSELAMIGQRWAEHVPVINAAGGAIVPGNATIILYLGQEKPDDPCTVPNVVGMTASAANKALTNAGLIMKVTGTTSASSGNVYALSQSVASGTEVEAGTVVTVQFGDNSVLD